jgi:hypothetical protein
LEAKVKVLIVGVLSLLVGLVLLLLLAPLWLAETETDVYVSNSITFGAIFLVVGFNVSFIGLVEVATDKASLRKKKGKIVSIALIVTAIGAMVPYSVWTFLSPLYTPNWTFSLITDRSTYELGESAQIRVTLENHGSVGHWFVSCSSNPIVVGIRRRARGFVWLSMRPTHDRKTRFMIPAGQSLERTFIWNQTCNTPRSQIVPDTYTIVAYIPLSRDVYTGWFEQSTFKVEKGITLTAT